MLAYVYWHRPRPGVWPVDYETRLRKFHGSLQVRSASFRLAQLPFASCGGYEDWYLVNGWTELGQLNVAAVAGARAALHAGVADQAGEGWGGIYALVRGAAEPPPVASWVSKPAGEDYEVFVPSLAGPTVWQRQLVLGPAAEFCLVDGPSDGRVRL